MKAIILLTTLVLTAHAQTGIFNVNDLDVSGNSDMGGNVVMGGNLAQGGSIGVGGCSSGNCGTRPSWGNSIISGGWGGCPSGGCSPCRTHLSHISYAANNPSTYPGLYPRPSPRVFYPPSFGNGNSGSGLNPVLPGLDGHGSGINLPAYGGAFYAY